MIKKPISADSHITEPPHCYVDYIDPKFRNRALRMERLDKIRDAVVIEGLASPIPMGLVAAAGKDPSRITTHCLRGLQSMAAGILQRGSRPAFRSGEGSHVHAGGRRRGNPSREGDGLQGRDDARQPGRRRLRLYRLRQGLGGRRRVRHAAVIPYPDRQSDGLAGQTRGPRINGVLSIIRGCQDVMGTFIFSGVFDRFPGLKVVCVEADAGWVLHYMDRMDHAYKRHRYWMKAAPLARLPSEYFRDNIYVTFQDDWVAFGMKEMCNVRQLMWANDFPHSDSTWPLSQTMLGEHTKDLREQDGNWICHENVAELYGIAV